MTVTWEPAQYRLFADHRSRPFADLLTAIGAAAPRRVVDLGCGTGHLTATLAARWPVARVQGIDSSPEMIAAAPSGASMSFAVGDLRDWDPEPDTDVVVSNAALQWVPEHRELLRRWTVALPAGAWLAFQVPNNFAAPSHLLMREIAESPRWNSRLAGVLRHDHAVDDPVGYARPLLAAGWQVNAWQTTYLHVLAGPDPVLEWVRGTGLRPILKALDAQGAAEFELDYAARLRAAYPQEPSGETLFPFRRVFVVGHRP